ncbi:MAG: SIMPL domain-containing protein [Nanoarchaeota archaeon]|nr:SIMPL domain-containing protein [Nanoarchaeota archaeon]
MEKSVQITLIVAVAVIIVVLLAIGNLPQTNQSNTVIGNGESRVKVIPDLVKVYFNVETKGATSHEAKDKNAEIVDELKTSLIQQGFENKDIQTTGLQIYPDYNWANGVQSLNGYRATHSIVVQLSTDKADRIGNVIDAGVDAGAGISYINFELSQEKQNQYKAEAIKLASQDARIKAEAMAEGAGKKLGRLVSISDSNFDYYPWRLYEAQAGSMDVSEAKTAATNIQPGEQEIYSRVTATFKLSNF